MFEVANLNSGSFVYFDPPYIPLKQDSFTKYAKDDFSVQMHYDLKDFCDKLDNLDVKFISAGQLGDKLKGNVEIIKKTKTLVFINCKISNDKEIVVTASGAWKIL